MNSISRLLEDIKEEAERRKLAQESGKDVFSFLKYTFRNYKRENWHHKLLCDAYQKVIEGEIFKLMVFAPPRHMKTEGAQRALSYALGKDPNTKLIVCGFGSDKARKISSNIKENVKDSVFSDVFNDFTNIKYKVDQMAEWSFGSPNIGGCLSAGVDGPITGEGFHIGYIDDPYKSRKDADSSTINQSTIEWYYGTFLTRQDESDSKIIYTSTRWKKNDLAGEILKREGIKTYNTHKPSSGCPEWNGQDKGDWHVINLPAEMTDQFIDWKHPDDHRELGEALWPDRFPMSHLNQFKRNKYDWYSQYQGTPQSKEGNLIKRDWFKEGSLADVDFSLSNLVRFWDIAATQEKKGNDPDFTASVLTLKHFNDFYILDVTAIRESPKKVERHMVSISDGDRARYGNKVYQIWEQQPAAAGKFMQSIMQNIFKKNLYGSMEVKESKGYYIEQYFASRLEGGNVFYVPGDWESREHDGNTFFDECCAYPALNHDDRIDSAAKCLFYLQNKFANTGGNFELL